ncbi:MAG TPA: hypothetical protein VFE90_11835 [Myxococcales bacterium]|nr:hypothetical protein [Myxococcales bacterium]
MALPLATALASLLAQAAVGVDGLARIETRGTAGTSAASTAPAVTHAETQVDASIGAEFGSAPVRFQLRYAPRVIFSLTPDPGTPGSDVLHNGTLVGDVLVSPRDHLRLSQSFSYGDQTFSPLVPGELGGKPSSTPPPLDPQLARLAVLAYVASESTVTYDHKLAPNVKLETYGTYLMNGGADAIGRTVLPLQHGVVAGSSVGLLLSPVDEVSFHLNANVARVAHQDSALLVGSAEWRTRLSRLTQADLSLGGGAGGDRSPTGWKWEPTLLLGAGITRTVPLQHQDLNAGVRGTLTSSIDRFGGGVYQVADLSAQATYSPLRAVSFGPSAGVSRALTGGTRGATVVHGDFNLSYGLFDKLALSLGVRGSWEQSAEAIQPRQTGSRWAAFLSLVAADHGSL